MSVPPPTIVELGIDLRTGRRTCVDVLEACFAAIDLHESRVHAWELLFDRDDLRRQAQALDVDAAAGHWRGPLHGIPIAIKDIVDIAGHPTAAGAHFRRTEIAQRDAPIVARLKQAGAVIPGKTVTTQFACFDPPVTRNPWNLERTPGGSSSGSAVAVATGMCPGAIGSQTGGSITRPASYCGIAGCKPTHGIVSLDGIVPVASSLDHPGPMAGDVRDLALLLSILVDPEYTSIRRGLASLVDNATNTAVSDSDEPAQPLAVPIRIGHLRELTGDADPAMQQAVDATLDRLAESGALMQDRRLPLAHAEILKHHRIIMCAEAARFHRETYRQYRGDYAPGIAALVEEGLAVSELRYNEARQLQQDLQKQIGTWFDGVDVMVCPAAAGAAPDRSTTGDPRFNSPWSYLGVPTVSFPIGSRHDHLPLGLQLIGNQFAEPDLFRCAMWCESGSRSDA